MPRENRAIKAKSEPQSKSPTEPSPEPEAQLRESQTSTPSQSDSNEQDLVPEGPLRESQPNSDTAGPESGVKGTAASIKECSGYWEKHQEAMSTYISTQEAESRIGDDDVWAEVESARELSDGDLKDSGQRQEEPLAAGFQTLISGAQVEWEIEDDPLHTEIIEVARDSVQDRMQPSQTEAIQSDDSDPDDLDRGGRSMWLARNEVSPKISQESDPDDLDRGGSPPEFLRNELYRKKVHEPTHHVANPTMKPPGQSDPEPASRTLHSNTENRPESTESETQSASPSSAPQYHKVQTTEMVRSETTRIIRSFQQENIRIETVLKPDPDIHTLREKEEKLEDHELMLSNLIDELMIDLKKTRGELKGISRKYRKALGDF